MSTLKTILKWIFGVFFLLVGLGASFKDFLAGIIFLLLGIFILPPTYELFEKKTKLIIPTWGKWTTVIVGFVLASFAVSGVNLEKDKEMDLIVAKASEFINSGQIDSANVYIQKAKKEYSSQSENKAIDLERELIDYNSPDFVKETLVGMTDTEFEQLQSDSLTKPYFTQSTLNKEFIRLMKTQAPERQRIIKGIEEKKEQERIAAKLDAERKKEEELNKNRKKTIEKQFSIWDGSHRSLTKIIKKSMNDPDSYEHVDTRFRDDGNSIYVITKFRGKNAFNGTISNTISARVDFNGNVIEIISQN